MPLLWRKNRVVYPIWALSFQLLARTLGEILTKEFTPLALDRSRTSVKLAERRVSSAET
jgi:hypothetical protein